MDLQNGIKNYGSLYLACNDRKAFFTSSDQSRYTLWSCQNVCDALSYLLDNIYIRFGTKLYRQIVGIPMGTNCVPLVAELQLNKANISDTEAPFLDLHLSVANGFVSSKIYDKRDDFDFDIVNFPFLDGDVPRASYGVYISNLLGLPESAIMLQTSTLEINA